LLGKTLPEQCFQKMSAGNLVSVRDPLSLLLAIIEGLECKYNGTSVIGRMFKTPTTNSMRLFHRSNRIYYQIGFLRG